MRRKDGKPKTRAKRAMPRYTVGFKDHPHGEAFNAKPGEEISMVSLFAGCGGLDLGFHGGFSVYGEQFERLNYTVAAAYDNLPDAIETYRLNLSNDIELADLTQLPAKEMPAAEVLTGGFPCQDFSSSGPKTGFDGKRGRLYLALRDYMRLHRPSIVVGENVPHLERLNGGKYIRHILKDFEREGYNFDVWNLYGPDYGLPQSRRRLFLIGVRDDQEGFPIKPPGSPKLFRPIDKALQDLEYIDSEEVCNQSQYYVASKATSGGGQGDHVNQIGTAAYCIRANPRGRIQFHYRLPRRLTVRECARLQSFPDEFVFPFSTQRNILLIGNAVPPMLGHLVGKSVQGFLNGSAISEFPTAYRHTQAALFQ